MFGLIVSQNFTFYNYDKLSNKIVITFLRNIAKGCEKFITCYCCKDNFLINNILPYFQNKLAMFQI